MSRARFSLPLAIVCALALSISLGLLSGVASAGPAATAARTFDCGNARGFEASGTTCDRAGKKVSRCGRYSVNEEKWGFYIVKGRIGCLPALRTFKRVVRKGDVLPMSIAHYRQWACGGHMGYYYCEKHRTRSIRSGVTIEVQMRSCKPLTPGCPRTIRPL